MRPKASSLLLQTQSHRLSTCAPTILLLVIAAAASSCTPATGFADHVKDLQERAVNEGHCDVAHWGWNHDNYLLWGTHSNRLVPVYTFGTKSAGDGVNLDSYTGVNSPYRSEQKVRELYTTLPANTVSPTADYMDQTNIADIQRAAIKAGKKHIFLVVFDGMDWQTTRDASIHNLQKIAYESGRGTGLHFQDYTAHGNTQFSYMVTSPHNDGTKTDVDTQTVKNPGGTKRGGYDVNRGGAFPWSVPTDAEYIVAGPKGGEDLHAYTDSAASATSMTAGIKTYNDAINIDPAGQPVETVAHLAQHEGYSIGVVTSVPISHATPACAYAHNVNRDDYQDLTRDLLGLPSIQHPQTPLSGVDVLIGCGAGVSRPKDPNQGENFVPGNAYLTDADLAKIDVVTGGHYVVAQRTSGVSGVESLKAAAALAAKKQQRLFGYYGVTDGGGHLPFQTADGKYDPTIGRSKKAENYSPADLHENPTLADMTAAALTVLQARKQNTWLMVEAGDVDWANHDNNIDNSIGAVNSGDAAVKVITDWVEKNSNWDDALLIVTADHGHYLVLDQPQGLITPKVAQ
ncbi:MAG: alkaline phosphatase [Planctomycetaceae bacterium]